MKKTRLFAGLLTVALLGAVGIGSANAAPSDYMHYETTGGVETITICDPNDSSKCITMMDRNLGATKAGTGCSATDTGACGYHYQRGNNYGFAPNFSGNDSFPNGETVTTNERVDTTGYGPGNFYSGNIFRKITSSPYAWSTTRNDNLRGGAEDSESNNRGYDETTNTAINATGRRGPCEEGYHVPSIGEWNTVLKYWAEENGIELGDDSGLKHNWELNGSGYKFQEDFKIPFAGYRGSVANVYELGDYALLRSSSPSVSNEFAQSFVLRPDEADANGGVGRVDAISLRCFKDSALGFPSAASQVVFWTGEVAGEPACSGEVLSGEVVSGDLLACVSSLSKQYYTLSGWKDVEADAVWTLDTPVTTGLNLQAIWTPDIDSNNNGIADQEESFIITREDGDGNFVWSGEFAYGVSPAFGGTQPEKTGYTFSSRDPAVQSVTGDFTYVATWTANEYSITFDTDGGSAISPITGNYKEPITAPSNPTKAGAVFDSWSPAFPDTMPLGGATLKAIWRNALSGGGSAGGGGVKKEKDDCPNGDYSPSYYDGICGEKEISEDEQKISEDGEKDELQTAYERAYENGITTIDTVEKADLNGNLTRIAMAKMLSKYAINVLGKTPANTIVPDFNDVDEKLNAEYDDGVSLAYQLGIMGINMPNNNFRPFDLVSRAEFVTALSRMRYGTPDGEYAGTAEYYKNHMEILSNEGIVSLLDPEMKELRGYVMVMLMRSAEK